MGMSGTLISALILVLNTGPADRYEDPEAGAQSIGSAPQLWTFVHDVGHSQRLNKLSDTMVRGRCVSIGGLLRVTRDALSCLRLGGLLPLDPPYE